jgi:hypothetical protein
MFWEESFKAQTTEHFAKNKNARYFCIFETSSSMATKRKATEPAAVDNGPDFDP